MTDESLLRLIPPVGGGVCAKGLSEKLVHAGHKVSVNDLGEQLVRLCREKRLKRIGVYYWRVA